ncbi:hypothetical protein BJV77DRAFT_989686 [Russula vinacea]|nr:hypothetical protein BJV77DRAFT_989686 [Russula vinacea]
MCVRESVESAVMEESDDNPFGRPTPCKERWRRFGAWSSSGATRILQGRRSCPKGNQAYTATLLESKTQVAFIIPCDCPCSI